LRQLAKGDGLCQFAIACRLSLTLVADGTRLTKFDQEGNKNAGLAFKRFIACNTIRRLLGT
jgi:hypothetical protein